MKAAGSSEGELTRLPVERRIEAMSKLAERGWPIGLRIDPLIAGPEFEKSYRELVDSVFQNVPAERIHSATVGPMRLHK